MLSVLAVLAVLTCRLLLLFKLFKNLITWPQQCLSILGRYTGNVLLLLFDCAFAILRICVTRMSLHLWRYFAW